MKFTKWEFGGKDYYLSYNIMAAHQIYDLGVDDLPETMAGRGAKSLELSCRVAEVMIQQGELVRRYMGYDPGNVIAADALMLLMGPKEDYSLRSAIMAAVLDGLKSETDDRKEIDLGLIELQKKTENS